MDRRHLATADMLKAIGMLEGGLSQAAVARVLNTSRSVINRLWLRYQETGEVNERHSGRRRISTERQDRFIILYTKRHRTATARQLVSVLQNAHGVIVSDQTIRNRLHEAALFSRRPLRAPALRRQNRGVRLRWTQEHANWDNEEWAKVMFSDESRFCFSPDSRRIRVWRQSGPQHRLRHIQEVHRYGGGSILVWAGIMMDRRTVLVFPGQTMNFNRYLTFVLTPIVKQFHDALEENFVFMHDNARPHVAREVQLWFQQEQIPLLPWPAQSPDLNPIEHLWDELQRAVTPYMVNIETIEDFQNALLHAWDNIPQERIVNLISSMPRRCQAVINVRGGHTGY